MQEVEMKVNLGKSRKVEQERQDSGRDAQAEPV